MTTSLIDQPNDARAAFLRRFRLEECSECRSWYHATPAARFFHSRRCSG
jgi:hypothetical protein